MDSNDQVTSATRNCEIASRLLSDAAKFFRNVAEQNPHLSETMMDNAKVYEHVAELILHDPLGKFRTD